MSLLDNFTKKSSDKHSAIFPFNVEPAIKVTYGAQLKALLVFLNHFFQNTDEESL